MDGELQILHRALQESVVLVESLMNSPKASQHGADNCNHVFSDKHNFIGNFGYAFCNDFDVLFKFLDLEVIDSSKNCCSNSHSSFGA